MKATLKFKIERLQLKGKLRRNYGRYIRKTERMLAELNRAFDAELENIMQLLALGA